MNTVTLLPTAKGTASQRSSAFLITTMLVILCSLLWATNSYSATPIVAVGPSKMTASSSVQLASKQEIEQLKKLLVSPSIQQWLQQASITSADNTAAGNSGLEHGFRDNVTWLIDKIRQRNADIYIAWQQVGDAPQMVVNKWQSEMSNTESLRSITYILIFLFVGAGFEWLYAQYTGRRLLRLELQKPSSLKRRINIAFYRALLTFGGLFCFSLGSIGVFLSFKWPVLVEHVVMEILIVILMVRIGTTIIRFFLAPRLKELRLVPLTTEQAKTVFFWSAVIIVLTSLNIAVSNVFDKLISLFQADLLSHSALSINLLCNLILLLVALIALRRIYLVFKPCADGGDQTLTVHAGVYRFWAGYFTILLILSYVLWMLNITLIMQSALVIGLLIPLSHLFRTWIDYLFDQATQLNLAEEKVPATQVDQEHITLETQKAAAAELDSSDEHPYNNYRPIARRLMRFVLVVSGLLMLMIFWGYNPFSLSSSATVSGQVFKIVIDIIAAVLIADLVWIWAKTYIDKRLGDYCPPEDGHAPGPEARMATLLPLLRTMLIVTLFAMVSFSVLATLGFNIGPLLAGAGVIGLAIGFGAQTLVKDVVSGIFYLIDDAFRVGEYIEVGDLRGTVESMSIRSLRVRHHRGAVHTIPFGELKSITNHSRDWVIMKLEFRIPFDTNMKKVKKLIKKIGKELLQNADFGHSFIEPLKSQGVRRMEEFNMVLGVKFMTKPGEQWVIRREAYHQIRDTFEANGIHLAQRNVKVEVLHGDTLAESTKQAVAAAAQNAVDPIAVKTPIPDEP